MDKTPKPGPGALYLERLSGEQPPGDTGDWVLVATLVRQAHGVEGVPVMARDRVMNLTMRRYDSAEEAMALSMSDSAMRIGGGWVLNLRTGETVRVTPMR